IQQRDTGKICFRYMFPQTLKSILNRPPLGFFYHEDLILDKPGKERKRPDVIWPEQQGFKEIRCKINDISIHISLERPCMDLAWRHKINLPWLYIKCFEVYRMLTSSFREK